MNPNIPFLSRYPHSLTFRTIGGSGYVDQPSDIAAASAALVEAFVRPTITVPSIAYNNNSFATSKLNPPTGPIFEIPARFTPSGRQRAIPFPFKLMKVLSDEQHAHIISWMPSGRSFIILRPKAFETDVLPKIFKSAKYSSFTRKLSRWGFIRCDEGTGEFRHPKFQKGRIDLVEKMAPSYGALAAKNSKQEGDAAAGTRIEGASGSSKVPDRPCIEVKQICTGQVVAPPSSKSPSVSGPIRPDNAPS